MSEQIIQEQIKSFEDQYGAVYPVESYGSNARYIDVDPHTPEIPLLVAGGWSEGFWSLKDAAEVIFEGSDSIPARRALVVEHPRFGKADDNPTEYADVVYHKSDTLLSVLEDAKKVKDFEKVNVVAHSEGAINSIVAALQEPELFNNIVLAMPAGMIGKDSVLKLAARFTPKVLRSLTKDTFDNTSTGIAINAGGSAYIGKNPVKATQEVIAMANTTIDEAIESLREKGVKVAILQSNADTVFPAKRIEQQAIPEGQFIVDAYSSVIAKDAGHDDPLINPQRSMLGAMQIIDNL